MLGGWYPYLCWLSPDTGEQWPRFHLFAWSTCSQRSQRLSGPAPFLHLGLERDGTHCEKPVKGDSLLLAMSFWASGIPNYFNHCIIPADLIVQILVIKTADSLPVQLERPVQWFWRDNDCIQERCMFFKWQGEDLWIWHHFLESKV